MNYECLLQEAADTNLYVIENATFESNAKGLINNTVIGLNKNLDTTVEKTCVLAEELGHYHTSTGDILDQSSSNNRKQEHNARLWAYNRLIGLRGIIKAYEHKCSSRDEVLDFLDVTNEFFEEAIQAYAQKYGPYVSVDNYVIFFTPSLGVMEIL